MTEARRRTPLLAVPALLAVVLCWVTLSSCNAVGPTLEQQTPASCADCHCEIARQWRASTHAGAWTAPAFVAESKNRSKPECLGCHAPNPLFEDDGGLPTLRVQRRADGVDCAACHKDDCAQAGPYRSKAPHPTRKETRLRTSAFCGRCHEMEFKEYRQLYAPSVPEADRKTCAECHMPMGVARLTQGHLLSKLHPRRVVRDHSFLEWKRMARTAVEASPLDVVREGDGLQVTFSLTNTGAGHRIPTRKHGYAEVRVRVLALDADGETLGQEEESMLGDAEEGLAPGEARPVEFTVDVSSGARVAEVRLLVERLNEDETLRIVLLDVRSWKIETR